MDHKPKEGIMSIPSLGILMNAILYVVLAYVAVTAATAEKEVGRSRFCYHHRIAAAVYGLLGVIHLLHR